MKQLLLFLLIVVLSFGAENKSSSAEEYEITQQPKLNQESMREAQIKHYERSIANAKSEITLRLATDAKICSENAQTIHELMVCSEHYIQGIFQRTIENITSK
jgi:hypothetical protein